MKDLTGQRFGRLVALNLTGRKRGNSFEWACECDCGNITYVASRHLASGNTKSCGCLRKETAAKTGQMSFEDLTGKRFGRLVALRPTEKRMHTSIVWECACDCGNTVCVSGQSLAAGETQSCGCLRIEHGAAIGKKNTIDLTGQRFGRLLVLRPTEKRMNTSIVWECACDCGNTAFVPGQSLVAGVTQSCGCLKIERTKERIAAIGKKNTIDLTGQRFGRLLAVRRTDMKKNNRMVWECKCDCGNTVFLVCSALTSGNTQSCGCLRKESAKENGRQNKGRKKRAAVDELRDEKD